MSAPSAIACTAMLCVNRECPKHHNNAPQDTPVYWADLSPDCPDYQDLPEFMDEISGTGALMGVWD